MTINNDMRHDDVAALETAGCMGKLAFQYATLLSRDGNSDDADDVRSDIMDRLVALWRSGGMTVAEYERQLTVLWNAAHEFAEAEGREFGVG